MNSVDDSVTAVLDEAVPDREVADASAAGLSWNDQNRTVRVEFTDGGSAFLKVAADGDGTRIARERAVVDYVDARRDVAVPTVLASGVEAATPYLLTAPMAGENFHRPWEHWGLDRRVDEIERVGAALGAVNAERFDRHGEVVGGGADGLELDAGPWTDVLVATIEQARGLASSDRFDHYFDAVVDAVEANRALLDRAPAALVHGDPAMPNAFCSERAIGFIDWELAHVGDPARDLNRAREQLIEARDLPDADRDRLVAALREGYRRGAGSLPHGLDERRPVYEAVRLVGVAGAFDKAVEHSDRSQSEYAGWLEAEMERRLDALR
ncbi:phosphotransferase family protein [Halosimplex aquaticum]|uniref:Phosphotransferase family protein n=1 Tax=Halosimplex aquaticum TaxID=3026162 RepID=A0ABD5Y6G5_9EURY|nr:phosphotransferase [Halosimplex aquaticum]